MIEKINKKLAAAIEAGDTRSLKELKSEDADFSKINLVELIKEQNNIELITFLIENGANVNMYDENNSSTPLISATIEGNLDLVSLLLKNGADVKIQDKNGIDALMATNMSPDISEYMIKNDNRFYKIFSENGREESLPNKKIYLEIAQLLLDNGAVLNDVQWYYAMMENDIDMARLIINNCDNNDYNFYMRVLILASSYNMNNTFSKSIKYTPQRELEASRTKESSAKIFLKIFQLLINAGVNLDIQNNHGYTVLITSVVHGNTIMTEALIKNGANLDIETDKGYKAIDYALENKKIRTLLIKHGARLSKRSSDKSFLKKITLEIRKEIKRDMPFDEMRDLTILSNWLEDGTVLSKALKNKSIKKLKSAVSIGANLSIIKAIDLVKKGYSPKFIDIAVKNGVKINGQDEKGMTALMHACQLEKKKIVKVLAKNRADIDLKDLDENDAWYYASISHNQKIMNVLRNYEELSIPNHSPKELVKVLSNFTRDTPMKYTTHIWDFGGINKEYKDYKGFMSAIQKQWGKLEDDLYELSPDLHKKIFNFLLNEDKNADGWFGSGNISIGWSSLEGLDDWCDDGRDPFKFKLEESFIVENEEISTFGDIINLFKREIEIRKEYNMLEKIFIDIEKDLSKKFSIESRKLSGQNFYTDVETFKDALSNIFSEIQKRDFSEIEVKAVDSTGECIDLSIVQIDSVAQQSSESMLKEVEDGNFGGIKELLTNLCDWSIESSFEDEYYRVNYLRSDKNIPEIEILDYEPNGFTYKLRFYK